VVRKHREALNISADPPGNETDITQNKKFRQCVIAIFEGRFAVRPGASPDKKKKELQEAACAGKKLW
jgi:hypothetical protein